MAKRRPLTDAEVAYAFEEFLYHGEVRDFWKAQHSFERISASLGTEDFDALVPPCLEVLEFSSQFIRIDTLLCLLHISLGRSVGELPGPRLLSVMRRNAAALARHDVVPMLVRSLDFLLGQDATMQAEDGMVEREFRLIFNCVYLQLLFHGHDEAFVRSLELGQGRLGAPLVALLFEAAKACADNERIPIKKVVLLLLRVLHCLLNVSDETFGTPSATADLGRGLLAGLDGQPSGHTVRSRADDDGVPADRERPRVREFQAFTALHLHERSVRAKYNGSGYPAAIAEGLEILRSHKEEFLRTYRFHPAEIAYMQANPFLHGTHARYEDLASQGLVASQRKATRRPPARSSADASAVTSGPRPELAAVAAFGMLDAGDGAPVAEAGDDVASEASASTRSATSSSAASGAAVAVGLSRSTSAASSVAASDATVVPCVDAAVSEQAAATGTDGGLGGRAEQPRPAAEDASVAGAAGSAGGGDGGAGRVAGTVFDNGSRDAQRPPPVSQDASPDAAFQRLYSAICPRLTETVMLLLRLLLSSCSNVESYPGVVDMTRERLVAGLEAPPTATEDQFPGEVAEAQRQREIMASAVSGVLLILLKQARRSMSEQFSSLAQLITDSNGVLVVLKFLNQDLTTAMEQGGHPPVLKGLTYASGFETPPSWLAVATLRLVGVLYLLCKDSPERVRKYLIHYKAPFILKRLLRIENDRLQRLVLKLLKRQVRYLPRKWKQANMKAVSAIYASVPMSPLEDWLLNEPFGDVGTEGPTQAEIRAANVVYNASLLKHLNAAGVSALLEDGAATPAASAAAPGAASACGAGAVRAVLATMARREAEPATHEYAKNFPEYVPALHR